MKQLKFKPDRVLEFWEAEDDPVFDLEFFNLACSL